MTRKEKEKIIDNLTEEIKTSDAIVVCNYKGLKVSKLEILRNRAREEKVKVQVIKNTLASIAMQKAGINGMELKDTNIFLWGDDQLAVSKVAAKFNESFDIFAIKSAYIDQEITGSEKVQALSKMPSRDELLAMLLQVWKAPIANFTIGLDALRAKKESE